MTVRLITQAPLPQAQTLQQSRQQPAGPAAAAGASAFARTLCDPPPPLPSGKPQPGGVSPCVACLRFQAPGSNVAVVVVQHAHRAAFKRTACCTGVAARRDAAAQAVSHCRQADREDFDDELVEEIFGFHTPSPDDVVLAARSQATGRSAAASEPATTRRPVEDLRSVPAGDTAAAAAARPQPSAALQNAKPAAISAKAASSRPCAPRRPEAAAESGPAAAAAATAGTAS